MTARNPALGMIPPKSAFEVGTASATWHDLPTLTGWLPAGAIPASGNCTVGVGSVCGGSGRQPACGNLFGSSRD